jgi:hypothetical protein
MGLIKTLIVSGAAVAVAKEFNKKRHPQTEQTQANNQTNQTSNQYANQPNYAPNYIPNQQLGYGPNYGAQQYAGQQNQRAPPPYVQPEK